MAAKLENMCRAQYARRGNTDIGQPFAATRLKNDEHGSCHVAALTAGMLQNMRQEPWAAAAAADDASAAARATLRAATHV